MELKFETSWRCNDCEAKITDSALLRHELPAFKRTLFLCPVCGSPDLTVVCDVPECGREATCGWPSEEGYRRTCGDHAHWRKS